MERCFGGFLGVVASVHFILKKEQPSMIALFPALSLAPQEPKTALCHSLFCCSNVVLPIYASVISRGGVKQKSDYSRH